MKKILYYIVCLLPFFIQAQGGFGTPYIIDNDNYGFDIKVAKINNGGLLDVVMVDFHYDLVAWYENTNGNGQFGTEHIISQNIQYPVYVEVADLNGDNDMGVLVSFRQNSTVAWFENLDGQGNFSSAKIITSNNAFKSDGIKAADIDGDNDIDVVWAASNDNKLVWFENLNGQGTFSSEKIISSTTVGVYSLALADIDGDGDTDVVCNSSTTGYPSWFENLDGQGTFSTEKLIDNLGTFRLFPADIDNDGDLDLVKYDVQSGNVILHWLRNIDGLGTFEEGGLITNLQQVRDVFPVDIDNDGDLDIYVSSLGEGKVAWFENLDGQGTFGDIHIIDDNFFSARAVYGAKIDSDDYNDVVASKIISLGAGQYEYNIVWYRNLTYLGMEDQSLQALSLYPNPVTNVLQINNPNNAVIKQIQVYNLLGKEVIQVQGNSKTINVSNLQSGVYIVKITGQEGVRSFKVVKE